MGRLSTIQSSITHRGMNVLLQGGSIACDWSAASSAPDSNRNRRRELGGLVNATGANLIVLCCSPKLWADTSISEVERTAYKEAIDGYFEWALTDDYWIILKFHLYGKEGSDYSGPGSNYKCAENEPYRTFCTTFFEEAAARYYDHNCFGGLSLMNEPYSGSDWDHWDNVIDWYVDTIDAVQATCPDVAFYCQPVRNWGGNLESFLPTDHPYCPDSKPALTYDEDIPRSHTVYELHQYYYNKCRNSGAVDARDRWACLYGNWKGTDPLCPEKGDSWDPIAGAARTTAQNAYKDHIDNYIASVRTEYNEPVIMLEWGVWDHNDACSWTRNLYWCGSGYQSDSYSHLECTPNWAIVQTDKMDILAERNIGSAVWRFYDDNVTFPACPSQNWNMLTGDGYSWNPLGTNWANSVQEGLPHPSSLISSRGLSWQEAVISLLGGV